LHVMTVFAISPFCTHVPGQLARHADAETKEPHFTSAGVGEAAERPQERVKRAKRMGWRCILNLVVESDG